MITGISDYQLGGQGVKRLATEANFIQGGYTIRLNHKQDLVGDFVKGVAKYWKQLLMQFGSFEMFAKITGEDQQPVWQAFKVADMIPDDVSFSVDTYASTYQAREVLQKQALDRLNILAPFIQAGIIDPMPLLEDVFKSYGLEDAQRYFTPDAQAAYAQMRQQWMMAAAEGLKSIAAGDQAIDINSFRQPAPTDVGATGRAASGDYGTPAG